MRKAILLAPVLALALGGAAPAQEAVVNIPALPYLSSGTARFFPVARDLVVPPGGHIVQILNVFNFDKASVQAVAQSTPGEGAFHVRIGYGPPHVFDPSARLDLTFAEAETARGSEIVPVRGPRMALVLDNERAVPVTVSVGVYATN